MAYGCWGERLHRGAVATPQLADLDAEVIKVANPSSGDPVRVIGSGSVAVLTGCALCGAEAAASAPDPDVLDVPRSEAGPAEKSAALGRTDPTP